MGPAWTAACAMGSKAGLAKVAKSRVHRWTPSNTDTA